MASIAASKEADLNAMRLRLKSYFFLPFFNEVYLLYVIFVVILVFKWVNNLK